MEQLSSHARTEVEWIMRTRNLMLCLLPLCLFASRLDAGAKAEATAPALVVQVRSLDRVFDQAKLILSLIGRDEIADKIDGLLRAKIGAGGFEGVDHKKPFGVVVNFGKEIHEISPLFLVPISDEKAFLKVLENNKVRVDKGKSGHYTARIGRDIEIEVYFRFANGYLYATMLSQDAIADAKLIAPSKILGDKDGPALAATLRIDQVPLAARQIALGEFEKIYASLLREKTDTGVKSANAMIEASLENVAAAVKSILMDGQELKFTLDLDAKTKTIALDFALAGKPGSDLAKSIDDLGKQESRFGGLVSDKNMFNAVMNVALPEKMHKAMESLFDEVKAKALEELTDKTKRMQAEGLFAVIEPTFKSGRADAFFLMNVGPDKTLDYLVALGVKDGKKMEKTLRALVEKARAAMPKKDQDKIKLDFAKHAGVAIHRIEIPEGREFDAVAGLLGDRSAYFAFRDDAAFVALGKGGVEAIKNAVSLAKPAKAPLLLYRADMSKLATLMAGLEGGKDVGALFPAGGDNLVLIRIEGGRALTARIQLPLNVFLMSRKVEKK